MAELTWSIVDTTLTISGTGTIDNSGHPWDEYVDSITKLVIEEGITSIACESFSACEKLVEVILPEGLISIGSGVFYGCSLTDIVLPSSIVAIYTGAFSNNLITTLHIPAKVSTYIAMAFYGNPLESITVDSASTIYKVVDGVVVTTDGTTLCLVPAKKGATEYTVPSTVTDLATYCFYGNDTLTSISLPEGLESIAAYTFKNCTALLSIGIPEGVSTIFPEAFAGCTSLMSVSLSESVTDIRGSAFRGCVSLHSINLPSGLSNIDSSAFSHCESLARIDIPAKVTSISTSTFYSCTSLAKVLIPASVTEIQWHAFEHCVSLKTLRLFAEVPPVLPDGSILDSTPTIVVPCGCGEAYKTAEGWSAYAELIVELDETEYYICYKSLQYGIAVGLGLVGTPVLHAKRRIVGYLYNRVILPALPDFDMETYPYALISHGGINDNGSTPYAYLYLSTTELYRGYANNLISLVLKGSDSGSAIRYKIDIENGDTDWSLDTNFNRTYSADVQVTTRSNVGWANYKVYNKPTDSYFEFSEPVPVYE